MVSGVTWMGEKGFFAILQLDLPHDCAGQGRSCHESDSLEQSRPKFPFSGGDDEQYRFIWASQVALVVKNLPANAGDIREAGSIPGSG